MKVKNLNIHIKDIIAGYRQQYQYYQELMDLSQQLLHQLGDPISADYLEGVDRILRERGKVIDNLKEIEADIKTHQEAVMGLLHLREFNLEKVEALIHTDLRKELREQEEAAGKIAEELESIRQLIDKKK